MECKTFEEMISLQADEMLGEQDSKRLDAHLASCSSCTAFRKDIHAMSGLFRSEPPPPEPSPDFDDRVLKAARLELAALKSSKYHMLLKRLCAAALLLCALTVSLFFIAPTGRIHAVGTETKVHYEDLFQAAPGSSRIDMLKSLLKTDNPQEALRIYNAARRRR